MLPVGYEEVPKNKSEAFRKGVTTETTILVADNSRKSKTFHCVRWEDILLDLNTQLPNFINVRKLYMGLQTKSHDMRPSTSHCILEFVALKPLKS